MQKKFSHIERNHFRIFFQMYLKRVFIVFSGVLLLVSRTITVSANPFFSGDKDSTKGFKTLLSDNTNKARFDLNPKVQLFVTEYLNLESKEFDKMKVWGQPYFSLYDKILSDNGLPVELKYLSVVESSLQAGCVSWAGAVGPWQLMPDEAKRFGLRVDVSVDERTDFYKSTIVAAKLLKELYNQYNDWLLVIAAYNCGKGNVQKAIAKAHSTSFWDLEYYLPDETRNHVKKYIATHYYFEGGGGWTTLTAQETANKKLLLAQQQQMKEDSASFGALPSIQISGKYNSVVIANTVGLSVEEFNKYNPLFDKTIAEGKNYLLHLPQNKLDIFKAKKSEIIRQSVELLLTNASAQNLVQRNVSR